jgi:hypothetical protein
VRLSIKKMKDILNYPQGNLRVTHLHSPEPNHENEVISTEEYELWIKEYGEEIRIILPRGVLDTLVNDEFEETKFLNKFATFSPANLGDIIGAGSKKVYDILKNVYIKEQEKFESWKNQQNL